MHLTIRVRGGNRLKGSVRPIPNKNALVAVLPASVLSVGKSVYEGVAKTSDVEKLLAILRLLGAKVDDRDYSRLIVDGSGINSYKIDRELGSQFRASFMFVGPLLARFGKAEVPVPGGCVLGERSVAAHVDAFSRLGVEVSFADDYVKFVVPKKLKKSYSVWQMEASVTATENLAMLASGIESRVEILDAACEPHVVDLLRLLSSMGANIEGAGTNRLVISGKRDLRGGKYVSRPDFVDIAGIITAVAVTDGEVRILGGNVPEIVDGILLWFEAFNISIVRDGDDLVVSRKGELRIDLVKGNLPVAAKGMVKLSPRPWPGFPVDVIPVMVTLASKTSGRMLIQNWMYESGLDFVREMNALGADILMLDPQRIMVSGPVKFRGGEVYSPGVIQACKAIFLVSLCDRVETVIHGAEILNRRYPDVIETYRNLGAEIEVIGDL